MRKKYLWRLGVAVAVATAATVLAAVALAAKESAPTPLVIHAEFNSILVPFDQQPDDCQPPFLLVRGTGIGSGQHIGAFAAGTAAECSLPTVDENFVPIFDVHGKGTFTAPDGSVLYLDYRETSENPFVLPPPWVLHDRGTFEVNGNLSTGRFHGATGHGTISADVPITCDVSFNCAAHPVADYVGTISFPTGRK
jgi:hypothetical protein